MPLDELLDRLAAFTPTELPVISLYLNAEPDQHGRDSFGPFVRKALQARAKTYPKRSPARESFERDRERIGDYLRTETRPSANGLVIFACAGGNDFFEAVQLDAPIPAHRLYVSHQPHLYPLARALDQTPRFAALIADTNFARLFVGVGQRLDQEQVRNAKVGRTAVGGWSQARYQRHVENYHLQHAKEVVEVLDRAVREDQIERVVLAGDEVIIPVLRDQLPPHLADKVIDVLRLDITTPDHDVFAATLEALREQDAKDDAEKVARLLDEYRAGGLAVVGVRDTMAALAIGQVDELMLSANWEEMHEEEEEDFDAPENPESSTDATEGGAPGKILLADELVTRARQTDTKVTFIDDPDLLADVGGIGALLRYRL